ncbi:Voltage-gated potassium channel (fragment) [Candidatus Methylobacter favarea]|uniref:Voltage-gated potassium channel n=1 Tax=Candidatus Methylobacter favarea TaxID=2707345 RepID=A0A8S0WLV9_9GAMM
MTRLIVYFAYFLKTSTRYQRVKLFFYNLLENPNSRLKSYFDIFMIGLVMLSIFLLIQGVDSKQSAGEALFEQGIISLFIVEYLLRGWLYSDNHKIILEQYEKAVYLNIPFRLGKVAKLMLVRKIRYVFTPLAVVDLLAILPSYRPLRILRIFLVFRLFKLFRYFNSIKLFARILASKRFELITLGIFLGLLVFTGSTGIYLFENPANGGQVKNLFEALYWAIVTVATVGYGDITSADYGRSSRCHGIDFAWFGHSVLSYFHYCRGI